MTQTILYCTTEGGGGVRLLPMKLHLQALPTGFLQGHPGMPRRQEPQVRGTNAPVSRQILFPKLLGLEEHS